MPAEDPITSKTNADLALFIMDLARLAEFRSLGFEDMKKNDERYRKLMIWWGALQDEYKVNLSETAKLAAHLEALPDV